MTPPTLPAAPLAVSGLTVLNLPMSDPRVRPLLDELAHEYDSRYGSLFGHGAAAEELNRYPAEEFAGPGGALLIVRENGQSVAGGAFRRYGPDTAEFKRIWTISTPPPGPCPVRPRGTRGAGSPPRLPQAST